MVGAVRHALGGSSAWLRRAPVLFILTLDCMTTLERGWGMLAECTLPFPSRDRE